MHEDALKQVIALEKQSIQSWQLASTPSDQQHPGKDSRLTQYQSLGVRLASLKAIVGGCGGVLVM